MAEQCALENNLKVSFVYSLGMSAPRMVLRVARNDTARRRRAARGTQVEKYCMKNVKSGQFNIHLIPALVFRVIPPLCYRWDTTPQCSSVCMEGAATHCRLS